LQRARAKNEQYKRGGTQPVVHIRLDTNYVGIGRVNPVMGPSTRKEKIRKRMSGTEGSRSLVSTHRDVSRRALEVGFMEGSRQKYAVTRGKVFG
jgi:hypothetical protein